MSKHASVSLLALVLVSASCLGSNPQTPAPATPPPGPASAVAPMVPPPAAQPPPLAPPAALVISPDVQEGGRVTFRLQAPKAGEVTFNGDWLPTDKPKLIKDTAGIWSITLGPLPPGTYIYSYNVDGVAVPDPHNPFVKLRARSPGSFVTVPGPSPGFADAMDVPHGDVQINWQKSSVLGDTRAVYVYTPPGYAKDRGKQYPVLYLLHGRNGTAGDWTSAGAVNFILDNLIAEKRAVPMIVVMPWGHPLAYEAPSDKNTEAMENYLLKDVMPATEAKYRVRANRQSRALIGLSMGGAQTFYIGMRHLDLFSQLATFSAGSPPGEMERMTAPLLEKPDVLNKQLKLLWIGCARSDSLFPRNEAFAKKLDELKIKHTFHPTEGFHNWAMWREYLHETAPLLFR